MKPETCHGCPLYNADGPIWGTGTPNAKLIVLGQNPGPTEIKEGRPFAGSSGRVLDRGLSDTGISRTQNFVTNVVKCYVAPGSPVPPGAAEKCRPLLDRELANLKQASTVLTLGAEAFNDFCRPKRFHMLHDRKKSRGDVDYWLRGTPYYMGTFTVIPTIHPAFVMRTGFMLSPVFEADLAKAFRFLSGLATQRTPHFVSNPSNQEVYEYVQLLIHKGRGGLDIETPESVDEYEDDLTESSRFLPVNLIGLSADRDGAIQVRPDQYPLLRPLFEGPHSPVILWAYNAGFDFYHLQPLFKMASVTPADAMLAFHTLRPEIVRKDLATCLSFYTDLPFHKNLQDLQPDFYNGMDTCGVLEAGENMLKELAWFGTHQQRFRWSAQTPEELFWRHLNAIIPELSTWNTIGAPYDQGTSDRMEIELRRKLEVYELWWREHIPLFDWSSPKQVAEMFTVKGIKVPRKKRPNGKFSPSVDDKFLETLAKNGNATANLIRTMRRVRHAGDFLNLADPDRRLRCRPKPHGQVGGRIQTVQRNVQQIPEELAGTSPRNCITSERPCDVVISADFSQIEFWAYAWYSQCKRALEIKESGDYLYGAFYEDIWNEPFFRPGGHSKEYRRDDVPPWKLLVAKSWPLGFTYGRGTPNPADQGLPIDRDKARSIHTAFKRDYWEFFRLHEELKLLAAKYHYLQTVFGRLRRFPNPEGQHNEILAFPGQSTAVDILIRNVLLSLPSKLIRTFGERSRIYFTVHDSAIMNVNCDLGDGTLSRSKALDAHDLVKASFEAPIPEMGGYVFPCETKIGPSWGQGVVGKEKFLAEFTAATV